MTYSLAVVVLSGPIASGKTTLAADLARLVSASHVSTSGLISASAGRPLGRDELQRLGSGADRLGADWIIDAVRQVADRLPTGGVIVVDAARTIAQVRRLRVAAASVWRVVHVHLSGGGREFAG